MYLQETNQKALELLHEFRYLTTSQFIKLGLASSQPSVSRIMQRFFKSKKPLVNKLTFPLHPTKGKLQNLYCLNKYGALVLAEIKEVELEEINYLKGSTFLSKDYFHRVSQIDFHIELFLNQEKENYTLDFFLNYFYKIGANNSTSKQKLQSKTKITYQDNTFFIPDGIYQISKKLEDNTTQKYLYTLEIHKGNDTKRAIETIEKNIKAIVDGSVSKRFNYPFANKTVIVFDSKEIKENVYKRFTEMDYYLNFRDCLEFN